MIDFEWMRNRSPINRSNDGINLFVAECKHWIGPSDFHDAIDQLFGRYLTVRDSKVALIIFVKNKNFNNTLDTIKKEVVNHKFYRSFVGKREESSFSYIFHFEDNPGHEIFLEIMLFHFV